MVPFDGSRTVVVAAVRRHVVINAVYVLDIRTVKDHLPDGFGWRRLGAIEPNIPVRSLEEVNCVFGKIGLQTTLRMKAKLRMEMSHNKGYEQ